jgi:hypothetical protein
MPRAKGPEKDQVKLWLRKSTIEWLGRKANGKPVPTYLAERLEQEAANKAKTAVSGSFQRDAVSPNFKKRGKK